MQWNKHFNLRGRHSFLAPSNHSWKNYDDQKLISVFESDRRKFEGTLLHEWAEHVIDSFHLVKEIMAFQTKRTFHVNIDSIRQEGEKSQLISNSKAKETIFMYVHDAVELDMVPEQPLSYDDEYCFGTADAIQFDGHKLRIHDLKTGETPASMDQLIVYAALFCLEYRHDPSQLIFELRIYQTEQIVVYTPTTEEIVDMMNRIVHVVDVLQRYKRGEL